MPVWLHNALSAQLGMTAVFVLYSMRTWWRVTYRVPLMYALITVLVWLACFYDEWWADRMDREAATRRTLMLLGFGFAVIAVVFYYYG